MAQSKHTEVKFLVTDPSKFFESIDTNGDGQIDGEELRSALLKLGVPVTQKLIDLIMSHCDSDKNGAISREEFRSFCEAQDRRFKAIFDSVDVNKDGAIEVKELFPALKSLDYSLSDEEIAALIAKLDFDSDNQVTYEEFIRFYHLIPVNSIRSAFDVWMTERPDFDDVSLSPALQATGRKSSPSTIMLAGGIAGAVSRTLTAPLDRLKIILQAGHGKAPLFKSFVRIYQEEGVWAYFKGNGANVTKIVPETAIKFLLFDHIKKIIVGEGKKASTTSQLISGATAGLTSQALIYPLEITKTRLALAKKGVYRGISHCMASIAKHEGVFALYKGLSASALGVAPYAAIDLTLFNILKEAYIQRVGKDPTSLAILSVGGISSIVAQTATYPFALVRTRLQSQGMPGREREYTGLSDCFLKTLKREGFSGLFRGLLPNLMKSVPAISSSYLIFEKVSKALNK